MYPIVLISLIGIWMKDVKVVNYIIPLTLIGIPLEIYHYALQKLPIKNIFDCTLESPCNALQVNYLGFITIPLLCLIAFVVILSLCLWFKRSK